MPDGTSALQLVFGGDAALYAIVALSLYVSLCAVILAALVALPFGAFLALVKFPGRTFVVAACAVAGASRTTAASRHDFRYSSVSRMPGTLRFGRLRRRQAMYRTASPPKPRSAASSYR